MLAGLAAQSITSGSTGVLWAFGTTAVVFSGLLVAASVGVGTLNSQVLQPIRMVGSAVKKWSGYVLVAVGIWFLFLVILRSPIIGG